MSDNTTTARGILLPCPMCGEPDATIDLRLGDLTLTCQECNGEFDVDFVRCLMARWAKVVTWIEAMPAGE